MTRLVTCGWETGDPNENQIDPSLPANNYWLCGNTSPTPRAPSLYWVRPNTYTLYKTWQFAAAKSEIYVRLRIYITAGAWSGVFFYFNDSTNAAQASVTWSSSDKFLRVYRGNQNLLLGTSNLVCAEGVWHLLEFHWRTTTTTSSTDGTMRVWQDGTLVINQPGNVDSTQTNNINVQQVQITNQTNGTANAYDDLAVNDTLGTLNNGQIGEGAVVLLKPNGAGSNTNQTIGGTNTGANWSQENELPPSMTQYVYSATVGAVDTYALENIPTTGTWTVNTVEALAMAQNSDSGTGSIGLTVKSGATTNEAPAQVLAITPSYIRQQYETDPNTGAAWTNAAVNALEAGTTVR